MEGWQTKKLEEKKVPPPKPKCQRKIYDVVESTVFEVLINLVIMVNVIFIIVEMVEVNKSCNDGVENKFGNLFMIFSYIFLTLYTLEFLFKVTHTAMFGTLERV